MFIPLNFIVRQFEHSTNVGKVTHAEDARGAIALLGYCDGCRHTAVEHWAETLIYNENTGRQHYENLRYGSQAAVAYADQQGHNPPKAAVLIHIEHIFTLMLGKNAGEMIA